MATLICLLFVQKFVFITEVSNGNNTDYSKMELINVPRNQNA